MTDRCRQERTAALRWLIEDTEASGISESSVGESSPRCERCQTSVGTRRIRWLRRAAA